MKQTYMCLALEKSRVFNVSYNPISTLIVYDRAVRTSGRNASDYTLPSAERGYSCTSTIEFLKICLLPTAILKRLPQVTTRKSVKCIGSHL